MTFTDTLTYLVAGVAAWLLLTWLLAISVGMMRRAWLMATALGTYDGIRAVARRVAADERERGAAS